MLVTGELDFFNFLFFLGLSADLHRRGRRRSLHSSRIYGVAESCAATIRRSKVSKQSVVQGPSLGELSQSLEYMRRASSRIISSKRDRRPRSGKRKASTAWQSLGPSLHKLATNAPRQRHVLGHDPC